LSSFAPLREELEKRVKAVQAIMSTAETHPVSPDEACELFGGLAQAQSEALKFVEANAARCGIPAQIGEQLSEGLKKIEATQKSACTAAQSRPADPSLSEILAQ
jgi:hypothetical protein